jgi:hypothetical protein
VIDDPARVGSLCPKKRVGRVRVKISGQSKKMIENLLFHQPEKGGFPTLLPTTYTSIYYLLLPSFQRLRLIFFPESQTMSSLIKFYQKSLTYKIQNQYHEIDSEIFYVVSTKYHNSR